MKEEHKKLEKHEKESEIKQTYNIPFDFNKVTNQESRKLFLNRQKVLRKF